MAHRCTWASLPQQNHGLYRGATVTIASACRKDSAIVLRRGLNLWIDKMQKNTWILNGTNSKKNPRDGKIPHYIVPLNPQDGKMKKKTGPWKQPLSEFLGTAGISKSLWPAGTANVALVSSGSRASAWQTRCRYRAPWKLPEIRAGNDWKIEDFQWCGSGSNSVFLYE